MKQEGEEEAESSAMEHVETSSRVGGQISLLGILFVLPMQLSCTKKKLKLFLIIL